MKPRKSKTLLSIVCITALIFASLMGCESKRETGAVAGAGAGAVIGANVGEGGWGGAALGAVIGGLAGYAIGDYMEKRDKQQVASTLETTPTGTTNTWVNPDTNTQFAATPTDTRETSKGVYRDVTIKVDKDNDGVYEETTQATAYRQPDGSWTFQE